MSSSSGSKYETFLDSYNRGFNQFQDSLTAGFFLRIQPDIVVVLGNIPAGDTFLSAKMTVLVNLSKDNQNDAYTRLKVAGRTLQEIGSLLSTYPDTVKKHLANIMNAFFDVAKETEDEELLKIAASISQMPK